MSGAPRLLIGVDVGGTGSRARVVETGSGSAGGSGSVSGFDRGARVLAEWQGTGSTGQPESSPRIAADAVNGVLDRLRSAGQPDPSSWASISVGIGATGFGTLASALPTLRAELSARLGGALVALAADAVTAHLGALGGEAGVTVASGTGAIALGDDGAGTWIRVDGWGHLLGDRGSAAWIGRRALDAALAAHDGRDAAGRALLDAAVARYGVPATWPAQFYGPGSRPARLAAMAPEVPRLAEAGDAAATAILRDAASELAASAAAALRAPGIPALVATVGGVFSSQLLRSAFADELAERHPAARLVRAQGTPLDGAIALAARGTRDDHGPDVDGLLSWS